MQFFRVLSTAADMAYSRIVVTESNLAECLRQLALGSWIYSDPGRCPGLRLHHLEHEFIEILLSIEANARAHSANVPPPLNPVVTFPGQLGLASAVPGLP